MIGKESNDNKIDAIIFDLDGTLWDSTNTCLLAWSKVMSSTTMITEQISKEQIQNVSGMKHDLIGAKLFPYLNNNQQKQIMENCYAEEINVIKNTGGELYDNVENVLKELSENFKLFIVSNCQSGYIEAFNHFHKLDHFFLDFECSGNTGLPKNENIKSIINRNSLTKPVYIGDTQGDYEAATANNIPFIYASYGFGLIDYYDYVVNNFSEILNIMNMIEKES